jgi:DNA-binding transcriptional LysR family regulator
LQLTPEGCVFYERGLQVLADLDEAERCASAHADPRGRLRVNANVPFGHHFLLPLLPQFLARHPQVAVDLVLTDEVIDLLEQRTDVAVRAGPLKSSSLVARRLGATRMMIVAAPAYVARHGMPADAAALMAHNRLDIGHARAQMGWPLREQGQVQAVPTGGNARASDARRCGGWCWGGGDCAAGGRSRCRPMSPPAGCCRCWSTPGRPGTPCHAVRVPAFLDFLVEYVDLGKPLG